MRVLEQNKRTYKTQENAVKALEKVIDTNEYFWLISVNSKGRFMPVVIGSRDGGQIAHLVHHGVCVAKA